MVYKFNRGDVLTADKLNTLVEAINELERRVRSQQLTAGVGYRFTRGGGGTSLEIISGGSGDDASEYTPPFKVSAKIESGKLKATVAPGTIWTTEFSPASYKRFAGDDIEEDISAGGWYVCLKFQVYLCGDKETYFNQLEETIDMIDPDKTDADGKTTHDDNIATIKNCLSVITEALNTHEKMISSESMHTLPELEIVSTQGFKETDDWSLGDEYTYHHYVLASITVSEGDNGSLSISKKTQICGGDIWFDPNSEKQRETIAS